MKFGYLPNWTIPTVVSRASEKLLSSVWLIVALDSSRGEDLHKSYEFLKKQLPETAKWTGAGIRIEGRNIREVSENPRMLVPFSAVYVMDEVALETGILYDRTSEAETFEAGLPEQLKSTFLRPGIAAYFADGCGLNYCLADDSFATHLIEQGVNDTSLPASSK
jgi:hypothetical protein